MVRRPPSAELDPLVSPGTPASSLAPPGADDHAVRHRNNLVREIVEAGGEEGKSKWNLVKESITANVAAYSEAAEGSTADYGLTPSRHVAPGEATGGKPSEAPYFSDGPECGDCAD